MEIPKGVRAFAALILLFFFMGCAAMKTTDTTGPAFVPSLEDTTWAGKDSEGDLSVYEFKKGGNLYYRTRTGYYKNGTWRQEGRSVYFETNRGYARYEGTIEGDRLEGRGWNVQGRRWDWTATKKNSF